MINGSCSGGGREAGEENIRDGFVWSREGFIQLASVNVWTQCKTSIIFPDAKNEFQTFAEANIMKPFRCHDERLLYLP